MVIAFSGPILVSRTGN